MDVSSPGQAAGEFPVSSYFFGSASTLWHVTGDHDSEDLVRVVSPQKRRDASRAVGGPGKRYFCIRILYTQHKNGVSAGEDDTRTTRAMMLGSCLLASM